jgi:enoyl-CoA hydratase
MSIERQLCTIHLERPRKNAIDHAFMEAALGALSEASAPHVGAVILTARGSTFCSGLDLIGTLDFDRKAMRAFVDAFERFFTAVFSFDKPVIAAINGHAIAGGCILAMASDVRVMAEGRGRIGINEVAVGIPFPAAAFEIARFTLRPDAYADAFLEGRRMTPDEALAHGLVHQVCKPDDLLSVAAERAERLAAGPAEAFAAIKRDLRAEAVARIAKGHVERRERFLDAWFSAEGTDRRRAIVADVTARSTP